MEPAPFEAESVDCQVDRNGRPRPAADGLNLFDFLAADVYPRLEVEHVYTHTSHNWRTKGEQWRGGCPWHESKSGSSFTVTPSSMKWYCHGCCVGGDPIQYLYRVRGNAGTARGKDWLALAREVCEMAGVPFPEQEPDPRWQRHDTRRAVLESAYGICRRMLSKDTALMRGRRAYLESRGFTAADLEVLEVGFYPGLDVLADALVKAGHTRAEIDESAVLHRPMEGYLTFPWRDEYGRALTLAGTYPQRAPPDGKPKKMGLANPRDASGEWLKTKCSPYLFHRARKAGVKRVACVEGITDAALAQVRGAADVVGLLGSTLSEDQIKTLAKCGVESAVIALDPDSSGDDNTPRLIRRLSREKITPYLAPRLPDGMDPDEFILAHGIDAWKAHVGKVAHGYRHLAQRIVAGHGDRQPGDDLWADDLVKKACAEARSLPADRPDEVVKYLLSPVAEAAGVNVEDLRERWRGKEPVEKEEAAESVPAAAQAKPLVVFPDPVPASQLPRISYDDLAVLDGYVYRGRTSHLFSLPKVGKTTLLGGLVRAMGPDNKLESFLGRRIIHGKVLYVSEEHAGDWGSRVARMAIGDHLDVMARPIPAVDVHPRVIWGCLVDHLAKLVERNSYDLVVIDTLGYAWGVEDENSAPHVQAALNHLTGRFPSAGLLLNHHSRKSGGEEGTGARGSVALLGYVDVNVELRRTAPQDPTDCRRTLLTNSRIPDAPAELVFEMMPDGDVVARGGRHASDAERIVEAAMPHLPLHEEHAITSDELLALLGGGKTPLSVKKHELQAAMKDAGTRGRVTVIGRGVRNDPLKFCRSAPADWVKNAEDSLAG